jgi:hypothetical protein
MGARYGAGNVFRKRGNALQRALGTRWRDGKRLVGESGCCEMACPAVMAL